MLFIGPCVRHFSQPDNRMYLRLNWRRTNEAIERRKKMCKRRRTFSCKQSEMIFRAQLPFSLLSLLLACFVCRPSVTVDICRYLIILVIHVNNYAELKIRNSEARASSRASKQTNESSVASQETDNCFNLGSITCIAIYFIKNIKWILKRRRFYPRFFVVWKQSKNFTATTLACLLNNLLSPWLQFKSHFYLIPSLAVAKHCE